MRGGVRGVLKISISKRCPQEKDEPQQTAEPAFICLLAHCLTVTMDLHSTQWWWSCTFLWWLRDPIRNALVRSNWAQGYTTTVFMKITGSLLFMNNRSWLTALGQRAQGYITTLSMQITEPLLFMSNRSWLTALEQWAQGYITTLSMQITGSLLFMNNRSWLTALEQWAQGYITTVDADYRIFIVYE